MRICGFSLSFAIVNESFGVEDCCLEIKKQFEDFTLGSPRTISTVSDNNLHNNG